jgi:TonB family protein
MFEPRAIERKTSHQFVYGPPAPKRVPNRQRQLMFGSLVLLLAALALLLYTDRDFWFPDAEIVDDVPADVSAAIATPATTSARPATHTVSRKHLSKTQPVNTLPQADPPPIVVASRTVLPPLNVEVVAGNVHRTLQSNPNSVHVDMQSASEPDVAPVAAAVSSATQTTAEVTSNAAENVQMSANSDAIVSHSVKPGYPTLARQMKVQGSVVLDAMIDRQGAIQELHVVSGPPILANAAQEAVKQWHFKPHFQGSEAVETEAKITVNFTISTN